MFDAEGFPVILFDPVPLLRRRKGRRLLRFRRCAASLESSRRGDENRQRAYISMLAQRVPVRTSGGRSKSPLPSPTRAAEMVGMSARSAYALLDKPGAESFAKAWEASRAAMPGA